jgi:AGZA family xanthine/uracil permease-like MFS transporter
VEKIKTFFGFTERNATFSKEIIGGLVTFFATTYILAVQPNMMKVAGMDPGAVFTATAISAAFATILMGLLAKIPIALASGLGINAFIAFSVCGAMGFTWQTALAAVFVEGVIFVILYIVKVREQIIEAIPLQIRRAVALGIGLFIAAIGLYNSGDGILAVGGGTPFAFNSVVSGAPLLISIGLIITIVLFTLKVPGSIFISIIATTIIGIPMGITHLPESLVSLPPAPYTPVDIIKGLAAVKLTDFLFVTVSLLFVDMFDTVSTLFGVALQGNLLDKDGKVINVQKALLSDAIGTVFGSLFGATTVTSYIESSTGVASGARTGLASVVTGVLFLIALILSPIFLAIPGAATAPALIFVGFLMLGSVSNMNFNDIEVGLPVFITMVAIPFTYSISLGLAYGFVSYVIVKVSLKKFKDINIATWVLAILFLIKLSIG